LLNWLVSIVSGIFSSIAAQIEGLPAIEIILIGFAGLAVGAIATYAVYWIYTWLIPAKAHTGWRKRIPLFVSGALLLCGVLGWTILYKPKPPTLYDDFINDFSDWHGGAKMGPFSIETSQGKTSSEMIAYVDFEFSKTIFLTIYVPAMSTTEEVYSDCLFIADHYENYITWIKHNVHVREPILGSSITLLSDDLPFSGAIYVYLDTILSDNQLARLRTEYDNRHLRVEFRSLSWLEYDKDRRKER
jgi:hypothetical protein